MSNEQSSRDFAVWASGRVANYLAPNAVAIGGVQPQPMPAQEAFQMMNKLNQALPDLRVEVQQARVQGNRAAGSVHISGTQTGPLNLPGPGIPAIPISGKRVCVPDTFTLNVTTSNIIPTHRDAH